VLAVWVTRHSNQGGCLAVLGSGQCVVSWRGPSCGAKYRESSWTSGQSDRVLALRLSVAIHGESTSSNACGFWEICLLREICRLNTNLRRVPGALLLDIIRRAWRSCRAGCQVGPSSSWRRQCRVEESRPFGTVSAACVSSELERLSAVRSLPEPTNEDQ
jgi:hypothetical protein